MTRFTPLLSMLLATAALLTAGCADEPVRHGPPYAVVRPYPEYYTYYSPSWYYLRRPHYYYGRPYHHYARHPY